MKRINYLSLNLKNLLLITLKIIVLFIGLNIFLTTIFVIIKEQIKEDSQKEISHIYFKNIT